MDGPGHYHKSEQLLDMALDQAGEPCALVLAAAQVHATLALAAATVYPTAHQWAAVAAS